MCSFISAQPFQYKKFSSCMGACTAWGQNKKKSEVPGHVPHISNWGGGGATVSDENVEQHKML